MTVRAIWSRPPLANSPAARVNARAAAARSPRRRSRSCCIMQAVVASSKALCRNEQPPRPTHQRPGSSSVAIRTPERARSTSPPRPRHRRPELRLPHVRCSVAFRRQAALPRVVCQGIDALVASSEIARARGESARASRAIRRREARRRSSVALARRRMELPGAPAPSTIRLRSRIRLTGAARRSRRARSGSAPFRV